MAGVEQLVIMRVTAASVPQAHLLRACLHEARGGGRKGKRYEHCWMWVGERASRGRTLEGRGWGSAETSGGRGGRGVVAVARLPVLRLFVRGG